MNHLRRCSVCCGIAATLALLAACSDVDIPASASDAKATVSGLSYDNPQGTRQLTLSWTLPAGNVTGVQIIKDDADIIELEGPQTSYFIKKAPTNVNVSYTVKARFADGTVSKGQTVRLFIAYEAQKGGSKLAMLVPNDYATGSADEKDAADWFKKNYVDAGKGVLLTPATIDDLDIEQNPAVWVMCDRIGIERGWQNLPGDLAGTATIEALKAFANDGGNLFLTNHATQLTVPLGRIDEAYAPGIYGNGEGGNNPDIWGVHPIIGNVEGQIYDHSGHDIYRGMTYEPGLYAGIYCFEGEGVKGDHNCMWDLNAYGLAPNPNVVRTWEETTNSTVLGTWNHVVDYCCAGIVDFAPLTTFPARILAVGLAAYEWNLGGTANTKQSELEKFTANCLKYVGTPAEQKVAMLLPNDYATGSADEKDAADWFKRNYVDQGKGVIFTPATIDDLYIEQNPVVWVMCDRIGIERGWQNLPGDLAGTATIEALKAFANDGGNLLLTNHATQLTVALGRIADAYAPGIYGNGEGGDNPDIWGVHPIIGNVEGQIYDHSQHDIYWGMTYEPGLYAGIYCFEGAGVKGDHNCMWDLNAYGLAPNPNVVTAWEELTNSTVLGTWNHVVDYCCAGIVDFAPTTACPARILAVGLAAYEWNLGGAANTKQAELERFTANCISYLK
jgi:hypothetical protein